MQPRKVAIANQKGGSGKTATTLGLASALAHEGRHVLVVDADPQGNATTGVGVDLKELPDQMTTADLLTAGVKPGAALDAIMASGWDYVDLIPADIRLGSAETDGSADIVFRLDVAFEGLDLSVYDAVLFDCPGSMGNLFYNVLIVADEVFAVTEPRLDSVEGVAKMESTIQYIARRPNPRLKFERIIINRADNTKERRVREQELREAYGDYVARTVIPSLVARADAHSAQQPIHQYTGGRAIALQMAYTDLAREVLPKEKESA